MVLNSCIVKPCSTTKKIHFCVLMTSYGLKSQLSLKTRKLYYLLFPQTQSLSSTVFGGDVYYPCFYFCQNASSSLTHNLLNLGAQLLQDHQETHGPEESQEEAAVTELPLLPVHQGLCVRHAPGLQKLCRIQWGEQHGSISLLWLMASARMCACRQGLDWYGLKFELKWKKEKKSRRHEAFQWIFHWPSETVAQL